MTQSSTRSGSRPGSRPGGRRRAVWLALTLALAVLALAVRPAEARQRAGKAPATMRAQVKAKLLALRAYRVTQELGLDEVSAARVFPLLSKYDQQVAQLTRERASLNKALRQPPADPAAIDEVIRRALANRRALVDLEAQRIGELRNVLSPAQTARLLVILPEIERQIKQQIRAQRQQRRQGGDLKNPFAPRGQRNRRAPATEPAPEPAPEPEPEPEDDDLLE